MYADKRYALQDTLVCGVKSNPRGVGSGRRLVEDVQGVGIGVEQVGHDEGGIPPSEDGKVDHSSTRSSRSVSAATKMEC